MHTRSRPSPDERVVISSPDERLISYSQANQLLFLKAEGIELMVLTIKEGRYASRGALRVC